MGFNDCDAPSDSIAVSDNESRMGYMAPADYAGRPERARSGPARDLDGQFPPTSAELESCFPLSLMGCRKELV